MLQGVCRFGLRALGCGTVAAIATETQTITTTPSLCIKDACNGRHSRSMLMLRTLRFETKGSGLRVVLSGFQESGSTSRWIPGVGPQVLNPG